MSVTTTNKSSKNQLLTHIIGQWNDGKHGNSDGKQSFSCFQVSLSISWQHMLDAYPLHHDPWHHEETKRQCPKLKPSQTASKRSSMAFRCFDVSTKSLRSKWWPPKGPPWQLCFSHRIQLISVVVNRTSRLIHRKISKLHVLKTLIPGKLLLIEHHFANWRPVRKDADFKDRHSVGMKCNVATAWHL